jgi:uncharacterized protein (DUF2252 family)
MLVSLSRSIGAPEDGGADHGLCDCGAAHLSNFGLFASPKRELLFDLSDFDETLPGPFEYDVKLTSARFGIAARDNGSPSPSRAT